MKANLFSAVSAALTLVATSAIGGDVNPTPVEVDLVNRVAFGDLVTARYSRNEVESIGCGIRATSDGFNVLEFGFCRATDRQNEEILCTTFDDVLIEVISASSSKSFILFNWDEEANCTQIGVSNQSLYLPKVPQKRFGSNE